MPQITFSGFVLPKDRNITFHEFPKMTIQIDSLGLEASCLTTITAGDIAIKCILNRELRGGELVRLYTRTLDATRTALDVLSFNTGLGYTLVLNEYTNNLGAKTELVIENPALGALCQSFSLDNPDFTETLLMFMRDPALGWALKDLIEANTLPNHASITCARAIESLRVLLTSADTTRSQAWGTFQTTLRISREFREYVTDISKGPRHGDRTPIQGDITLEVTRRAWQIMDRFIEYRKRGNQALPESGFPLL